MMERAIPMPHDKAEDQKFEAENDLRTLQRAAEIKVDKPRFRRAVVMAKKQMAALKKIQT